VRYDLIIAWNWEFDEDFVHGIERECALRGISTYRVDPYNLGEAIDGVREGDILFHAFFDRASDADPAFLKLVEVLRKPDIRVINPHDRVAHAIDKATMHLELITNGIHVPNTIILPPYNTNGRVEITQLDLDRIGIPFVIKPANTTGGGTGVWLDARTIQDVMTARQLHKDDKYLLQEKIVPKMFEGKRAWFRAYCVFDEVIICWWDDTTHMYSELHNTDEQRFGLTGLRGVMRTIQQACKLDFFSSEVAMTEERKYIVVDYVNEVCDMRLQSVHPNGAPDRVVHRIEQRIAREVEAHVHALGVREGIAPNRNARLG
jgi:hypothetical protein